MKNRSGNAASIDARRENGADFCFELKNMESKYLTASYLEKSKFFSISSERIFYL